MEWLLATEYWLVLTSGGIGLMALHPSSAYAFWVAPHGIARGEVAPKPCAHDALTLKLLACRSRSSTT